MDENIVLGKTAVKINNPYDSLDGKTMNELLYHNDDNWNKKLYHEFFMTVDKKAREAFLIRNSIVNGWKIFPWVGIKRVFKDGIFLGDHLPQEKLIYDVMNDDNHFIWNFRKSLKYQNDKLYKFYSQFKNNNFLNVPVYNSNIYHYTNFIDYMLRENNEEFKLLCNHIKSEIDVLFNLYDIEKIKMFNNCLYDIFDITVPNHSSFSVLSNKHQIEKMFEILLEFYHNNGKVNLSQQKSVNYIDDEVEKNNLFYLGYTFSYKCNEKFIDLLNL